MPNRDIVSEVGSFYTGLSNLPVIKTTQTSGWIDLAQYDGCMVYIMAGNYSDGTITPVIHVADVSGTDLGSAAATDLVAWTATSTSSSAPVKLNDSNSLPTGNSQPNAISSAASAINQRVGYIGSHRYIEVVSTVTGSPSTGCGYDVIIVAGRPRVMPANV
jgi:hypothetical protein